MKTQADGRVVELLSTGHGQSNNSGEKLSLERRLELCMRFL